MKDTRIELKVGFFVAVGLALLAVLILSFSRGTTLFASTYKIRLLLPNAAGLKPTADIMMAGIPIGKATSMELLPDGRSVIVNMTVLSRYPIRTNSDFQIDALGFLGDEYISVTPPTNVATQFLKDGDIVLGRTPFNMQEAIRSVSGLLEHAQVLVKDADRSVNNLNSTILSEHSLTNLGAALANLQKISAAGLKAAEEAEYLVHSNGPAVDQAVANLKTFSEKLNSTVADLDRIIATNGPGVDAAIQNLRDSSASIKQVAADLQAGKGLVGGLLKDESMKMEAAAAISNANATIVSFGTLASNINQRGFWSMLWKPKHTDKKLDNSGAAASP